MNKQVNGWRSRISERQHKARQFLFQLRDCPLRGLHVPASMLPPAANLPPALQAPNSLATNSFLPQVPRVSISVVCNGLDTIMITLGSVTLLLKCNDS